MANQTELLNVSNEMKLDNDKQNLCEELSAGELCSSSLDTTEELYSSSATDACGDGCSFVQKNPRMIRLRSTWTWMSLILPLLSQKQPIRKSKIMC